MKDEIDMRAMVALQEYSLAHYKTVGVMPTVSSQVRFLSDGYTFFFGGIPISDQRER